MRLANFILDRMDTILQEWERFAATRGAAGARLDSLALRDHAEDILRAIAADIESPQTRQAQHDKSQGNAPVVDGAPETAAQTHAVLRARSGFDINQLVSEYRALRASVLRLWFDDDGRPPDATQVVRFNEAVDQAIAESVAHFERTVEQSRNLLLGMLGHDMRSPLQAIQMTAQSLALLNAGEYVTQASQRLINSGARMQALLDDLVDFNRSRLGLGIQVRPAATDLDAHFQQELELLKGSHPERRIALSVEGDMQGYWDAMRLRQVLGNLVVNALRHGDHDGDVHISLSGGEDSVRIDVCNAGDPLDPLLAERMFEPLNSGPSDEGRHDGHSLGLGLYIAREVARAHGGEIAAASEDGRTRFTVTLPRDARMQSR